MSAPTITRVRLPAVRAFIESQIWAIQPEKLTEMLAVVELHAIGGKLSADEIAARVGDRSARPIGRVEGAVAVIPLQGIISQRVSMMTDISGGCSAEQFIKDFEASYANPDIGAIVVDASSPGGSVEGIPEAAARMYQARGRGSKPVVCVANGVLSSAAYWLGSAADEIVATPSATSIGSIGVFMVHCDKSAMHEELGLRYSIIGAGKYKAEETQFAPLSEEARAHIQSQVDEFYGMFTSAVAKHRGVSVKDVRSGYGEGRSLTAKQALEAGLVDRIATLDDVVAKLIGRKAAPSSRSAAAAALPLAAIAAADTAEPTGIQASSSALPSAAALPTSPAPKARMVPVEATPTAAGGAATLDPVAERRAVREAETKRVRDISALCSTHKVDAAKASEYLASDRSVSEVGLAILADKQAARAAEPTIRVGAPRAERDPARGFRSPTEFMLSVIENAGLKDRADVNDERLRGLAVVDEDKKSKAPGELVFVLPNAYAPRAFHAAVGSDEQGEYADRYGGFTVAAVVAPGLMQVGFEGDPTSGRTQPFPMGAPTVKVNARVDKDHSTSVTGGFTFSRKPETVVADATRMSMEQVVMDATDLVGAAYATQQLLNDSPISFAAIIDTGFRDQLGAHLLNEKLRGLGGSEFQGVINAPCVLSVTKETNQVADTIVHANVVKMRARCWGYGQAIWLANHDCYPQLASLSVVIGASGALVYQQSVAEDRPDMLLGRPIFYTEFANTIGDNGDLVLGNWSQYLEGTYQPFQLASSIHVRFLQREQTFLAWVRNAGQPWWRTALTPKYGSTMSPFITLAARA